MTQCDRAAILMSIQIQCQCSLIILFRFIENYVDIYILTAVFQQSNRIVRIDRDRNICIGCIKECLQRRIANFKITYVVGTAQSSFLDRYSRTFFYSPCIVRILAHIVGHGNLDFSSPMLTLDIGIEGAAGNRHITVAFSTYIDDPRTAVRTCTYVVKTEVAARNSDCLIILRIDQSGGNLIYSVGTAFDIQFAAFAISSSKRVNLCIVCSYINGACANVVYQRKCTVGINSEHSHQHSIFCVCKVIRCRFNFDILAVQINSNGFASHVKHSSITIGVCYIVIGSHHDIRDNSDNIVRLSCINCCLQAGVLFIADLCNINYYRPNLSIINCDGGICTILAVPARVEPHFALCGSDAVLQGKVNGLTATTVDFYSTFGSVHSTSINEGAFFEGNVGFMICTSFAVAVHCTVGVFEGTVVYRNLRCTVSPEAVLYAVCVECTICKGCGRIEKAQTVDITVIIGNAVGVEETVIVSSLTIDGQVLKMNCRTRHTLAVLFHPVIDGSVFLVNADEGQFLVLEFRHLVVAALQNGDDITAFCCHDCVSKACKGSSAFDLSDVSHRSRTFLLDCAACYCNLVKVVSSILIVPNCVYSVSCNAADVHFGKVDICAFCGADKDCSLFFRLEGSASDSQCHLLFCIFDILIGNLDTASVGAVQHINGRVGNRYRLTVGLDPYRIGIGSVCIRNGNSIKNCACLESKCLIG